MSTGAQARPSPANDSTADAELAAVARELLAKVASAPRFTGSEDETRARIFCARWLAAEGFLVSEQQFIFSEFPGRYGPPIIGFLWLLGAVLTGLFYVGYGGAGPASLVFAIVVLPAAALASWLARRGTSRFPWMRSTTSNLVAARGKPTIWVIAHIDSKSQTISMLTRVLTVATAAFAFVALGLSVFIGWIGFIAGMGTIASAAPALAVLAALAAVPLVVCFTGNKSPGAADNASGFISVLLAVRLLRSHGAVGVILTSGEELGLAGARAYVASTQQQGIALNCDTIDDPGRFICMSGKGRRAASVAGMVRAAARLGFPLRVSSVIPGVLTDSIAFADAGWDSLTVSKGNIATLARVHTSSDSQVRLTGTGIAQAARLLAATVEELS